VRGGERKMRLVEPTAMARLTTWSITCINCADEQYVDLEPGERPTIRRGCAQCGGGLYVEHLGLSDLRSRQTRRYDVDQFGEVA